MSKINANSLGYADISALKLKVFNQASRMNTGIDYAWRSLVVLFSKYDSELFKREYGEYKKALKRDFR